VSDVLTLYTVAKFLDVHYPYLVAHYNERFSALPRLSSHLGSRKTDIATIAGKTNPLRIRSQFAGLRRYTVSVALWMDAVSERRAL